MILTPAFACGGLQRFELCFSHKEHTILYRKMCFIRTCYCIDVHAARGVSFHLKIGV